MSNNKNKHLILALVSLAICLLAASNNVCAQVPCGGYEVTAIIQTNECPPFGYPGMVPEGMNEDGWMVGSFRACVFGPNIAWLWTPEDGLVLIPMPPDTSDSKAVAICGSRIVGHHFISDDGFGAKAFLYDHSTNIFTDLGTLPGGTRSEANAINSKGEIVGLWGGGDFAPQQAFIWRDGKMIDLNQDFRTLGSNALDINANGIVSGWMGSSFITDAHAFIWDKGKITELPPVPGGFISWGSQINNNLQLAVTGLFNEDHPLGFINGGFFWEAGKWTDVGMLDGYDSLAIRGLNDEGTIVGWSRDIQNNQLPDTAFIWSDGEMIELDDLLPPESQLHIKRATAINQSGQIAVQAINAENDNVAVLLTPIPGPLADLNGDCAVSVADLLILFASWGPCDDCGNCPADLDGNCVVSTADLLILFSNWG